jgi:hypothetical protein
MWPCDVSPPKNDVVLLLPENAGAKAKLCGNDQKQFLGSWCEVILERFAQFPALIQANPFC